MAQCGQKEKRKEGSKRRTADLTLALGQPASPVVRGTGREGVPAHLTQELGPEDAPTLWHQAT